MREMILKLIGLYYFKKAEKACRKNQNRKAAEYYKRAISMNSNLRSVAAAAGYNESASMLLQSDVIQSTILDGKENAESMVWLSYELGLHKSLKVNDTESVKIKLNAKQFKDDKLKILPIGFLSWLSSKVVRQSYSLFCDYFLHQSKANSSACAIEYQLPNQAKVTLSYEELLKRVYQFANFLKQKNIQKSDLVAIYLPRSEQLLDRIVAILALLLIGAPYVPMDQNRFADVLKSGAEFLLTDKTSAQQLDVEDIAVLDIAEFNNQIDTFSGEAIETNVTPDDLAYVIYTSGSTGASKGVAIKHVGLPNVFTSIQDVVELKAGDKVAQITSLGFDASLCEIMMALGAGASLVLVPNEYRKDLSLLTKYYQECGVTAAIFVPSVLRELDQKDFPQLNKILITGEGFDTALVQHWLPEERIIVNGYGPTETTIGASVIRLTSKLLEQNILSIGYPMQGINLYLWDEENQQLLDPFKDQIGESRRYDLYVGGTNLMREYWQRADLTEQALREVSLPTGEKIKVYVSGDTVAFKNGHLHDVKRSNRMLKHSGKRVDLDGFEAVCRDLLLELKALAVVAIDDRAVAYLIGNQQLFNKQKFIEQLKIALPDVYMCLQTLVWIQELPKLATSGKVDYKKLATQAYFDQQDKNQITELEFADKISPRFALEKELAVIWRAELQWDAAAEFSIHASFAELGGSSFNLRKLLNRIQCEKRLCENVWPNVFKNPAHITLAKITEFVLQHWLVVKLREGESTQKYPGIYFIHSASGDPEVDYKDTLLRHMPNTAATIFGIRANIPVTTIEELAAHYIAAIKAQQPYGPYFLVGWSSGGVIAYEMAQQLTNQGEVVFLNMIDSLHPSCRDHINQLLKTPENEQKLERLLQNELPKKIIEASANYQVTATKLPHVFIQGVTDLGWGYNQITHSDCDHFTILSVPGLLNAFMQAIQKYLQTNPYMPKAYRDFLLALEMEQTNQLQLLLKRININFVHPIHGSYLHWAVQQGKLKIVEWLLKHGADIDAQDDAKKRPLDIALQRRDIGLFQLLMRHNCKVFGANFILIAEHLKLEQAVISELQKSGAFVTLEDLSNPLKLDDALQQRRYEKRRLQVLGEVVNAWQNGEWQCSALDEKALTNIKKIRDANSHPKISNAIEQYLLNKTENYFKAWLEGSEVDIELDKQACSLMLVEGRRENSLLSKQLNAASRALLFVQWHQGKLPEEIKIKLQNNIIDTALANDTTLIDVVSKWLNNKITELNERKYKRNTDNQFRQAFAELLLQWQQNYFVFDTPKFIELLVGYLLEYEIEQTLQDELDKQAVEFLLEQIRTGKLEDPESKAAINELLQKPLTAHLREQWHDEVLAEIVAQWQQGKLSAEIEQEFNQLLPAELLKLQREINDELYTQSRLDQLREKETQLAELQRQIQDLLARAEQLSQTIEVLQPGSVNDDDVTPNHSPRYRS